MKRHLLLIPFCLLLTVIACEKADNTDTHPEILSNTLESPYTFSKAEYLQSTLMGQWEVPEILTVGTTVLVQEMNAKLDKKMQEESGYMKPDWGYRKMIIRYNSVDSQGRPIQLRELVVFPEGRNWKHKVPTIILCSRFTTVIEATSPAEAKYLFSITAARDAVFICPEGQGFGDTNDRDLLFLGIRLETRQTLDGLWAAMDVLQDQNIALTPDHKFFNVGYSLGGATAMGVHKEYEVSFTDAMRNRLGPIQTVCGSGPFNPAASLKWFKNQTELAYPVGIPLSIIGMREAHPELLGEYPLEDFFSQPCLETGILDLIRSKKYSASYMNNVLSSRVGSTFAKLTSAELQDTRSPIYRAALSAFARENVLDGWKAKYPICLLHSKEDGIVPYLNSEYAALQLGDQVTLITTPGFPNVDGHYTNAAFFAEKILTQ